MNDLIWKLIVGGALALIGGGIAYVVVKGIIDKKKIREEMLKKNIKEALISKVNNSASKITLKDLDSSEEFEIRGDGIASDIREKEIIRAA